MSINFMLISAIYLQTYIKIEFVRPVSWLFTSAWIAKAIALGEPLFISHCQVMRRSQGRSFLSLNSECHLYL
jgi:hypothetical protein